MTVAKMFQSTPLREGRRGRRLPGKTFLCFNPRPCVRGDNKLLSSAGFQMSFNPRPGVRGDQRKWYQPPHWLGFNPRPCVRGDQLAFPIPLLL